MTRHRLFDAAVEEPDLVTADRRARRARKSGEPRARAARKSAPPVAPAGRQSGRRERAETRSPERVAASPMIDPRIAARRARVAAEEAAAAPRRGRRLAMVTIVLVVAGCAAGLVLLSPLAGVDAVEVGGAHRTGAAAVRAASGLGARPPLVRVDEGQVAARIGALPWVGRVRVERRWPRTVAISVEERRPAAVAPCAAPEGECLIDVSGRVLAGVGADRRAAGTLPLIAGVPAAAAPGTAVPESARGALAVAVALPDGLRPLVRRVRADGPDVALDLRAPGREETPPVVRLGPADRIPDKLTAAATVLARTSVNGLGTLDVRVPESPALTRTAQQRREPKASSGAPSRQAKPAAGTQRQDSGT